MSDYYIREVRLKNGKTKCELTDAFGHVIASSQYFETLEKRALKEWRAEKGKNYPAQPKINLVGESW